MGPATPKTPPEDGAMGAGGSCYDDKMGARSTLRPSMIDPSLGDLRRNLMPAAAPSTNSPASQDPTCDKS